MPSTSHDAIRDDLFPGNGEVFDSLTAYVKTGRLTLLTGAGVSAPAFPTWTQLLKTQLVDARSKGLLNQSELADYEKLLSSDLLEVAEAIEQLFSKPVFRTRLADVFRNTDAQCTRSHKLIQQLSLRAIVTLNYDNGHEVAYSSTGMHPNVGKAQDAATLTRWTQDEVFSDKNLPILHFHGDVSSPDQMVLTSTDYDQFYRQELPTTFLKQLWRSHRLLVVGFGFTDPFLTRVADGALRDLPADLRHFAIIGRQEGQSFSAIERRTFARKFRLSPLVYEVVGDGHDHSNLHKLLELLSDSGEETSVPVASAPAIVVGQSDIKGHVNERQTLEAQFKSDLFVAPSKNTLYVEPRFEDAGGDSASALGRASIEYSLSDVAAIEKSLVISCRPEYGSTTISRRLALEYSLKGKRAHVADASELPNYKRKLDDNFSNAGFLSGAEMGVLILDNFEISLNERLLKEVIGLRTFERIVVLARQNLFEATEVFPISQYGIEFQWLNLLSLNRADVRSLTLQFYDTDDGDIVSAIVEKVYSDLIALCIPVTPSNVVIYLEVVYKDGDFQPINRVHIVNRYLSNAFSAPSDAYRDSFTSKNKLDTLSAFVFDGYQRNKQIFTEVDWFSFCKKYKEDSLLNFDERQLLNTLKAAKIFVNVGGSLYFKYRIFHTFFLGRYVAHRPVLLNEFMSDSNYLRHGGLVEVISDLATDSEPLVLDILNKMDAVLEEFDQKFVSVSFDPFSEIDWPTSKDEDEKLWKPLNAKLAAGPRNVSEIDQIKRSILEEGKAANQNIIVQDFDRLERRFVLLHIALIEAMLNSDNLSGNTKKRAVMALHKTYYRIMQVGIILAPAIAKKEFFRWHGLVFINSRAQFQNPQNEERDAIAVMFGVIGGVSNKAADRIASRKLGEVFKRLSEEGDMFGFVGLLNFACLIRSKPRDWMRVANNIISKTGRNAFYLFSMMNFVNRQFHEEVNTHSEREDLKKVLAMIQLKREFNKGNAGEKDILNIVERLDKISAFDAPKPS